MPDESLVTVRCPYCQSFMVEASPGATIRRKCRECRAVRTVKAPDFTRWHGQKPGTTGA